VRHIFARLRHARALGRGRTDCPKAG